MNLQEGAKSFELQVADLIAGRMSRMRISEYYSVKNIGGAIQIHSTAPGAIDNEFMSVMLTEIEPLAKFFAVLLGLRSPVTDVMNEAGAAEEFVKELKDLPEAGEVQHHRKAIKAGDKARTGV